MNALLLFGAVDVGEVIKILVIILVVLGSAIGKLVANMHHRSGPPVRNVRLLRRRRNRRKGPHPSKAKSRPFSAV